MVLDEYIERLEREVENKRYFLRESHGALQDLVERKQHGGSTVHSRRVAVSDAVWREVMQRPMYLPERQDPIGLNLLTVRLEGRDASMEEWMRCERQMVELQRTYLEDIKGLNAAMGETIAEFERNPPAGSAEDRRAAGAEQRTLSELETDNEAVRYELASFIQQYMVPNDPDHTSEAQMMSLLTPLLNGEEMEADRARETAPALYRLLLRANLLELNSDKVKLLDLSV
ncbi:hypothetical protein RNJ44_00562 [Nakaseomyces bracarensis]|uniref:Uncharacterized protein n=1 Tax=Nakaseomyces bracarensis TaxID=273131 RepID=A0ABR4NT14_9SACH